MKENVKWIFEIICGMGTGCLAGYSVVQLCDTFSPLWVIPIIPFVVYIAHNTICLRRIKKKMRQLENEFKEKYGFDIDDTDAIVKYIKR